MGFEQVFDNLTVKLCHVDSNVRKRVLDHIFRDGKEAGSYGDVVLLKNVKTVICHGQRKLRMKKF